MLRNWQRVFTHSLFNSSFYKLAWPLNVYRSFGKALFQASLHPLPRVFQSLFPTKPEMDEIKNLRVAFAIGRGTGAELADFFKLAMNRLADHYSVPIELHCSPRTYHSYFSLIGEYNDQKAICEETLNDVSHYETFCREEAAHGTQVIFRTAINAQSLYLVRQHLESVKIEHFNQGPNSLLLIRDQAQGFYTGANDHDVAGGKVSRTCEFSKEMFSRIVSFSVNRARQIWGDQGIDSVFLVYKFHLFDGVFSAWAKNWSKEHGLKIEFVQPDTANRNLLAYGLRGRQLMIAGNEWADIMHVILLNMFGQGAQEARCTENIYLHPGLHGLSEFQTVHGSADDIAGKGIVNPSATLRAAAAILERYGGCQGLEKGMDHALEVLQRTYKGTRDQGGSMSTMEVVTRVLDALTESASPPDAVACMPSSTDGHAASVQ